MKSPILVLALMLAVTQPLVAWGENLSGEVALAVEGDAPLSLSEQLASSDYGSFSDVSAYLAKLQAMAKKNPALLLGELRYPYSVYVAGKVRATYKSKKEAKAHKTRLITKKVLASLSEQKAEDLFVNCQGVMIGDGEIWINRTERGEYYIKTINP